MKLTPLDIHHKEFHRAVRGYNEEEVDSFLDHVAEEFERLFKENIELKEQAEKSNEKATQFEGLQTTLQNALITAQKSADSLLYEAKQEADRLVREAKMEADRVLGGVEAEANRVLSGINTEKQRLQTELSHLTTAEADFRQGFRGMLESYLRLVEAEMPRPRSTYEPAVEPAQAESAEVIEQAETALEDAQVSEPTAEGAADNDAESGELSASAPSEPASPEEAEVVETVASAVEVEEVRAVDVSAQSDVQGGNSILETVPGNEQQENSPNDSRNTDPFTRY